MHFVREQRDTFRKALADKRVDLDLDRLLTLDDDVRRARGALDDLRAERKRVSDGFKTAAAADKPALGARSRAIGAQIAAAEAPLAEQGSGAARNDAAAAGHPLGRRAGGDPTKAATSSSAPKARLPCSTSRRATMSPCAK
jgi:hypothetical protein